MKILTLFSILAFLGTQTLSNGADDADIPWCIDLKASLNQKQLNCLRSLDDAKIIKNAFSDILRLHQLCPKCKPSVINGDKYINFYHSPFLITQARFAKGIGTRINLIFKDGPLQLFEAYVAIDDHNIDDLRVFETAQATPKMTSLIRKLRIKKFSEFWIYP